MIWFAPSFIIGCGGVGFDFLKKYIKRLIKLPDVDESAVVNMTIHFDADEKVLTVDRKRYDFIQKIFRKENLLTLLSRPEIAAALRDFDMPTANLQDTESGMSQSPRFTELYGAIDHEWIEAEIRNFLRRGFGAIGEFSQSLTKNDYAIHPRAVIWTIFGSGGGVGPAMGRRIGEILRRLKVEGAIPPATLIGISPLASIYSIDKEKKGRAMAINHALIHSLSRRMNSRKYKTYQTHGDKMRAFYLSGLFDFFMTLGNGQDYDVLSYDEIIEQIFELVWQTSFGGAGPEFLSTLANETRASQQETRSDGYDTKQRTNNLRQNPRRGNRSYRVPKGTDRRIDGEKKDGGDYRERANKT